MSDGHPTRLEWDAYFMRIAQLVAERSTCTRAKIGAVIVKDRNIIATGYNGSPSGMPHCTDAGCLVYRTTNPDGREEENCFRTIHAEINAIAQAAKNGTMIDEGSIYVTSSPCIHCLKVIVNVGMRTIYYGKPYKIDTVQEMLDVSGVTLTQVEVSELPEEMKG